MHFTYGYGDSSKFYLWLGRKGILPISMKKTVVCLWLGRNCILQITMKKTVFYLWLGRKQYFTYG